MSGGEAQGGHGSVFAVLLQAPDERVSLVANSEPRASAKIRALRHQDPPVQ